MKATEYTEYTEDGQHRRAGRELIHGRLTGDIRQVAFEIRNYFGYGFLEKSYENWLAHRSRKRGHVAERQTALSVRDDDGTVVGECFAEILVNGLVVFEVRVDAAIRPEHQARTRLSASNRSAREDDRQPWTIETSSEAIHLMNRIFGVFGVFGGFRSFASRPPGTARRPKG